MIIPALELPEIILRCVELLPSIILLEALSKAIPKLFGTLIFPLLDEPTRFPCIVLLFAFGVN